MGDLTARQTLWFAAVGLGETTAMAVNVVAYNMAPSLIWQKPVQQHFLCTVCVVTNFSSQKFRPSPFLFSSPGRNLTQGFVLHSHSKCLVVISKSELLKFSIFEVPGFLTKISSFSSSFTMKTEIFYTFKTTDEHLLSTVCVGFEYCVLVKRKGCDSRSWNICIVKLSTVRTAYASISVLILICIS